MADAGDAHTFARRTRPWVSALRWLGIGVGVLVAVAGGTGYSLPIGITVAATSYVAYVICTSLLWLVELTAAHPDGRPSAPTTVDAGARRAP